MNLKRVIKNYVFAGAMALFTAGALLGATPAEAGCLRGGAFNMNYCGPGNCVKDALGTVICSKFVGGGAHRDPHTGIVVCGRGLCALNSIETWQCAKEEGGNAVREAFGITKCEGGCEAAVNSRCVPGRPM